MLPQKPTTLRRPRVPQSPHPPEPLLAHKLWWGWRKDFLGLQWAQGFLLLACQWRGSHLVIQEWPSALLCLGPVGWAPQWLV